MKKIITVLLVFYFTLNCFSQEKNNQKIEAVGDMFEVTIFYDSGSIMQHGFLTKDNKLHASWESFYENGNRKCVAIYDHGVKVGTWYYWFMDKKTKVVYEDGEIVETEEIEIE